jgi:hypothetical protein
MFWPIVLFGSYWFWGAFAIIVLAMSWIMTDDDYGNFGLWAALVGSFFLLILFTDVPISWVWHNPITSLLSVFGYMLLGLGWSFFKWFLYLVDMSKDYERQRDKIKSEFDKNHGSDGTVFKEWVQTYHGYPPLLSRHKSRLMTWTFFWPISIFKFLFSDFLRKLWDGIYTLTSKLYQKITNAVFGKYTELN